jgi:phenylacetate-CoA ligase
MINTFFNFFYHLIYLPVIFRNQWLSTERVIAMQNRKLRKIVEHAYQEVPYYKEVFNARNLHPSDIKKKEDLSKLPILTKKIVKENYPEKILAKNKDTKKSSIRQTSGSSGNILEVALDLSVTYQYHLQQFRQLVDIGYIPTDKAAYVRYSPSVTRVFSQKIGLFRRDFVDLTLKPRDQIRELLKIRPNIINAYPSVLYLLAKSISIEEAHFLNLKFILSNSELLYDYMRDTIEKKFNCKVYNDYSCLEFSAIGFECRRQNLHIVSDNVIIEIIGEDGKILPFDCDGKIIVTALNNFIMPFIRYEIGDLGMINSEKCICGRGFPIFKSLVGRRDDFLTMPNGSLLDPQSAVFQVESAPHILEFQILQNNIEFLEVNVVIEKECDQKVTMEAVRSNLYSVIPRDIEVNVNVVDKIRRGSTGKLRSVCSKC